MKHSIRLLMLILGIQCSFCHKAMFYLKDRMLKGEKFMASNVIWKDGHKAVSGEAMVCQFCGKAVPHGGVVPGSSQKDFDFETGAVKGS